MLNPDFVLLTDADIVHAPDDVAGLAFFQLYPPSWAVSAAGACILIRPAALARIGGIASIRGELIDDCALARAINKNGNIWLGVTRTTRGIRAYTTFAEYAE